LDARERRKRIVKLLKDKSPLTGSQLATSLGVTRQVIVSDITVLRAAGETIMATPRGYTAMAEPLKRGVTKLVAVRHRPEETADELLAAVDLGVEVVDVIVDHPVYGQMTGQLSLSTRADVMSFLERIKGTNAGLLSSLTDGVHLHTVRGRDTSHIAKLESLLAEKGYLLTE
jgi:transcriptional regulator of NAD metabolism